MNHNMVDVNTVKRAEAVVERAAKAEAVDVKAKADVERVAKAEAVDVVKY